MLFLKLFIIFTKIGTFNFGGGYAMLSLIHNETVVKSHWLTNAEFTDIVAISQSTPGPIGINCATYVGYTACLHAGYRLGSLGGLLPGIPFHHVAAIHHHDSHQPLSDDSQGFQDCEGHLRRSSPCHHRIDCCSSCALDE